MLKVTDLHVSYGAIAALKGVSLEVNQGEIVALIGPNGAGKSTLLKTISGLIKSQSGSMQFEGVESLSLTSSKPHEIVACGLSHVPEGRLIFQNLTVKENLLLGAYTRKDKNFDSDFEQIFGLFPRLKERLHQNSGTLSGGEQQMLAISRALMARPVLLVLDEPSLGIAPALVLQIFKVLEQINKQGTTILLVEQDAYLALKTAHRAYVIETGEIKMQGSSSELIQDKKIVQAYLGE